MPESCLFCRIVRGEIPAAIVMQDDHCLAFRDINPQAPLHLLIIPKAHIATLNDLTAGQDALVGEIARRAAALLALAVGPAAWAHGWSYDDAADLDRLAGAVVAGHVIECGAQATGGNYAFFQDVPGLEHVGFPWAEIDDDGSSVIGKHDGTGGLVSVGTVTAQLLYEIGGPAYANPDVTAMFDTIGLAGYARGTDGRLKAFAVLVHRSGETYSKLTVRQSVDRVAATATGCY